MAQRFHPFEATFEDGFRLPVYVIIETWPEAEDVQEVAVEHAGYMGQVCRRS